MKEYILPTEKDEDKAFVYLGRIAALILAVALITLAHHVVTLAPSMPI